MKHPGKELWGLHHEFFMVLKSSSKIVEHNFAPHVIDRLNAVLNHYVFVSALRSAALLRSVDDEIKHRRKTNIKVNTDE